MKKNGFTLVELIAVIVILALILLIVTPNVIGTLNRSKARLNETQKQQVISAARNWGMKNVTLEGNAPSKSSVTISELQKSGYLEDKDIEDLVTKNNIANTKICITYENYQFVYTYEGEGNCKW